MVNVDYDGLCPRDRIIVVSSRSKLYELYPVESKNVEDLISLNDPSVTKY